MPQVKAEMIISNNSKFIDEIFEGVKPFHDWETFYYGKNDITEKLMIQKWDNFL